MNIVTQNSSIHSVQDRRNFDAVIKTFILINSALESARGIHVFFDFPHHISL